MEERWYKDGQDYTAQHSDCEDGMKEGADIVVILLGDERNFKICPKDIKGDAVDRDMHKVAKGEGLEVPCPHDSILTMGGHTQKFFRHGVPKSANVAPRISITFRSFKTQQTSSDIYFHVLQTIGRRDKRAGRRSVSYSFLRIVNRIYP